MIHPSAQHPRLASMLVLATGLALVATMPTATQAETLSDFITRKLKDMQLLGDDTPARAAPHAPARPSGATGRGNVNINGHPAAQVLSAPQKAAPQKAAPQNAALPAAPLPRPRPAAIARHNPGNGGSGSSRLNGSQPARTAVLTDAAGRVMVDPKQLLQERDHTRAVYLKPREIGHWDAATVKRVRTNCNIVLAALNVDARPLSPIGGPEGCGIAAPVEVHALGMARLKPPAKLNCRFTAALYEWMRNVVQPAARKRFGQPVVSIRQLSDYSCRRRGGITRGPVRISEHSFGNAIDIGYFELADGTRISLLGDWGEFYALFSKKSSFLSAVREGACKYFSTVLSPKYNKAHKNHFHLDLGRGGRYKICK